MAIPHSTNVGQFDLMIGCLLGKSLPEVLDEYVGYGCHCGLGGDGVPLDETDV